MEKEVKEEGRKSDIITQSKNWIKNKLAKWNSTENKIRICEKLGATKFQRVVFKAEEKKFKILKKICPNFIQHYDNWCNRKRDKLLKKYHSEENQRKIIEYYRSQKLLARKEWIREENRNYHMDQNNPMEFIEYLEWNKEIHQNGLKKNIITLPLLSAATICGFAPAIPFLMLEAGSTFINFQCVNIQNYNIYRFRQKEEKLKKLQDQKHKRDLKKYGEAAKIIGESLDKTTEIPSLEEIIDNIKTPEQLQQLRNLRQAILSTMVINDRIKESNIKGGKKYGRN